MDQETAEQFEALGRLTFFFSILDEQVTDAISRLLRSPDEEAVARLLTGMAYGARINRLRAIVKYLEGQRGAQLTVARNLLDAIAEAEKIGEDRNSMIHFHVRFTPETLDASYFSPKTGAPLEISAARADALTSRIGSLLQKGMPQLAANLIAQISEQ